MTDQIDLDAIEARANARQAAFSRWLNIYSPQPGQEALEQAEGGLQEEVPALIADVRRLQDRIDRAHQAMAERLAEVAEREADGVLPFGTPGASWCDAVTVTCARIEDALRERPESQHAPAPAM